MNKKEFVEFSNRLNKVVDFFTVDDIVYNQISFINKERGTVDNFEIEEVLKEFLGEQGVNYSFSYIRYVREPYFLILIEGYEMRIYCGVVLKNVYTYTEESRDMRKRGTYKWNL